MVCLPVYRLTGNLVGSPPDHTVTVSDLEIAWRIHDLISRLCAGLLSQCILTALRVLRATRNIVAEFRYDERTEREERTRDS